MYSKSAMAGYNGVNSRPGLIIACGRYFVQSLLVMFTSIRFCYKNKTGFMLRNVP